MFKTLNGRERDVSINRYRVNWEPEREVSIPQKKVKTFLRRYWQSDTVCEEFRLPASKMRLDIFNISRLIAVEVSPAATHTQYNAFMHGSLSGYRKLMKNDLLKEQWCRLNGLTLVTLIDEDIANLSPELFLRNWDITL